MDLSKTTVTVLQVFQVPVMILVTPACIYPLALLTTHCGFTRGKLYWVFAARCLHRAEGLDEAVWLFQSWAK